MGKVARLTLPQEIVLKQVKDGTWHPITELEIRQFKTIRTLRSKGMLEFGDGFVRITAIGSMHVPHLGA